MSATPPSASAMRVSELSQNAENPFSLRPGADQLKQIAAELELGALRKLSFQGRVLPVGTTAWRLEGRLGATVVQPCVVTLEPVTTRIDIDVARQFLRDFEDPAEPEVEMPEDDSSEALGTWIDPGQVMIESLAIAVPDYPRAEGAELGQMVYAEPGLSPMTDEDARPFAGLADLKNKLENDKG